MLQCPSFAMHVDPTQYLLNLKIGIWNNLPGDDVLLMFRGLRTYYYLITLVP